MKNSAIMFACIFLLAAGIAQATPFSNGSFENGAIDPGSFTTLSNGDSASITGWVVGTSSFQATTSAGGPIDYIGSYWTAAEGNRSLDMNGYFTAGSISQTFDTVNGQTYSVKFDLAGNTDDTPTIKILRAFVDSGTQSQTYTFDITGKSHGLMGWEDKNFTFSAGSNSTTLTFESLIDGAWGPALDNVSVSAVPEPGTMMLLGFGMLGLAVYGKRRMNKKEA